MYDKQQCDVFLTQEQKCYPGNDLNVILTFLTTGIEMWQWCVENTGYVIYVMIYINSYNRHICSNMFPM